MHRTYTPAPRVTPTPNDFVQIVGSFSSSDGAFILRTRIVKIVGLKAACDLLVGRGFVLWRDLFNFAVNIKR